MARRSKRKANIKSATRAVNRTPASLNFQSNFVQRKPRVVDRLCTALHTIHSATPSPANVKVEDLIDEVYAKADSMGETLGPRTTQQIHTELSRLYRNKFIKFLPHHDDVEKIVLTPACEEMIEKLDGVLADFSATVETASEIVVHRALCDFFRRTLQFHLGPAMTRRELDLRNRELELRHEEYMQHLRICPLERRSPSLAPTEIVGEAPGTDARDSMYFDDVPQVVATLPPAMISRPTTPIRRSATLNNPEAYPSPESAQRNVPLQHPTTPPQSPSFRRSPSFIIPGPFAALIDDDDEMDIDMNVEPSPLLAPQVDAHEECQAQIDRLEREIDEERTNSAAAKRERWMTLWVRQTLWGIEKRRLTRENDTLKEQNESMQLEKHENDEWVALGKMAATFNDGVNSLRHSFRRP
ncbi:hypothetical protein CPB84DRAFT_1770330 [Gymnopilus junonius]|uniref:Uncharacterized protein n=1 Tax=Gymnopilus junonius TaxID=109634 RepID=A0A9P5TQ92_GYMJU|nr:hypothetical protein CPB84DRAFT_1770330 [Gymnopilus junonius]